VFHVLKWTSKELERTIDALVEEELVQTMEVEGIPDPQLVPVRVLKRSS
jgi:hypothetical protein